jgi:hypothetical protein
MSEWTPILRTRSAHWGYEEHQYFGHAVFAELRGRESLSGLTALSVLGRRLSTQACALLDEAAVCLTLADPRIWPLKLTRVVAAYGHTMPAAAAGLLIQEDARIGPWAMCKAAEALALLKSEVLANIRDERDIQTSLLPYVRAQSFIWGFGTPFRQKDERLVAFRKSVAEHGCDALPHFRIFEALIPVVKTERNAPPNIAGALAAVLLDQGLTPSEIGPLTVALMQHMFLAHAVEGARQAPEPLRKLPLELIRYQGTTSRSSPRLEAQHRRDQSDFRH